jgi:DNA-directed RNA polymerase specialized sigma24 family protein
LSPADPPDGKPPDETPDSPSDETPDSSKNDSNGKWNLTQEAFDKLLETFSSDCHEAARRYITMRVTLTRYFEWKKIRSPEPQVDIAVDRVARRIWEGQEIVNLRAYFLTVAYHVWQEWLRDPARLAEEVEAIAERPSPPADEQKEARLQCLDYCLEQLPLESRSLILGYYSDDGRAKIDHRVKIAEALSIPLNALRIRAHRIRTKLEECIKNCLEGRNENGAVTL